MISLDNITTHVIFAISALSELHLLGFIRQDRLQYDGLNQPFGFATSRAFPGIGKQKCVFQSSVVKVRVVALGCFVVRVSRIILLEILCFILINCSK